MIYGKPVLWQTRQGLLFTPCNSGQISAVLIGSDIESMHLSPLCPVILASYLRLSAKTNIQGQHCWDTMHA